MPSPKIKIRKKPTNKRCQDGYPCKTTCISRLKNCRNPLNGQATTLTLWLKHQEEMLEITNKKRARVGLSPATITKYGYITAERNFTGKKEAKPASPIESKAAISAPTKPVKQKSGVTIKTEYGETLTGDTYILPEYQSINLVVTTFKPNRPKTIKPLYRVWEQESGLFIDGTEGIGESLSAVLERVKNKIGKAGGEKAFQDRIKESSLPNSAIASPIESKSAIAFPVPTTEENIISLGKKGKDGFSTAIVSIGDGYRFGQKQQQKGYLIGDYFISNRLKSKAYYQVQHLPSGMSLANGERLKALTGKADLASAKQIAKKLFDANLTFAKKEDTEAFKQSLSDALDVMYDRKPTSPSTTTKSPSIVKSKKEPSQIEKSLIKLFQEKATTMSLEAFNAEIVDGLIMRNKGGYKILTDALGLPETIDITSLQNHLKSLPKPEKAPTPNDRADRALEPLKELAKLRIDPETKPVEEVQSKSKNNGNGGESAPTLRSTKFNPFAKTEITPTDFQDFFYKDRPRLKRQDDPNAIYNLSYSDARSKSKSQIPLTKTRYKSEIVMAITTMGIVPSDAALAEVSLNKGQQIRLSRNRQEMELRRKRVNDFNNAIKYPLMTDKEKKGYMPTLSHKEADAYINGSYMEGIMIYHGTSQKGAKSISTKGMRPDVNTTAWEGTGGYFTTSKKTAESYATISNADGLRQQEFSVLGAKIKIKNPYITTHEEMINLGSYFPGEQMNGVNAIAITEYIRAKGYDSVYLKDVGFVISYAREQVVIVEQEDFSKESIRYQEITNRMQNRAWDYDTEWAESSDGAKKLAASIRSEKDIPFYDHDKNENGISQILFGRDYRQ